MDEEIDGRLKLDDRAQIDRQQTKIQEYTPILVFRLQFLVHANPPWRQPARCSEFLY
jgi:hypothetical protein